YSVFFFNDTATTEIYTLSLHDALPITTDPTARNITSRPGAFTAISAVVRSRSEEHTSELQSRAYLVCRLLLQKKKRRLCVVYFLIRFKMVGEDEGVTDMC